VRYSSTNALSLTKCCIFTRNRHRSSTGIGSTTPSSTTEVLPPHNAADDAYTIPGDVQVALLRADHTIKVVVCSN